MRHRERGVTFLGWVVLLTPMAILLYAGIRLTPVYLEYIKIARSLEQVRDEHNGNNTELRMLRVAIERRFDVEDVRIISARDPQDVKIQKKGNGYVITTAYTADAPLFANMYLSVDFSKVVTIE
jgi:hypothetical protein